MSNSPYSVISHKTIHTRKTVVSPCINYQHCIYLLVFMDDVQKLSELVSLNILLLSKMVNIPVLEFLQHYTGSFVTEVHKSDKGWNIVCVKNSVGKGYICVKSRPTRRVLPPGFAWYQRTPWTSRPAFVWSQTIVLKYTFA